MSSSRTNIICADGKMFELKAPISASSHGLSDEVVQLIQHAEDCLQRCKRVESCITQLHHETGGDSLFPIIVSRRPWNVGSLKDKNVMEGR